MDGRMEGCKEAWMDGWKDARMEGRIDGWKDDFFGRKDDLDG